MRGQSKFRRHSNWTSALLVLCLFVEAHKSQLARASETNDLHQQPAAARLVRSRRTVLSAEERSSCKTSASAQSNGLATRRRQSVDQISALLAQDGPERADADAAPLNRTTQTTAADKQQNPTTTTAAPGVSTKVDTSERLRQLRQLLISNNYDAYLVTPNDEHGSEYVSDYDRRLRFISAFTGSNGFALITLDRAVLFTDGRYALQAELDLDCNWALVVSDDPLNEVPIWTRNNLGRRTAFRLATDARLMSLQVFDQLDRELKRQFNSFEFALISLDLVDIVWNNFDEQQPQQQQLRERPSGALTVHPLEFAGQVSWQEKVSRLAELMAKARARYYVISKLDDIAWLLNLRGSDTPMTPLFKAYLLISRQPMASSTTPPAGAGPTAAGGTLSLEQLLAASSSMGQQQHQQQVASDPLMLQSPQVVQVPTSQLVKVTLYVDLRKVTAQVRDHLKVSQQLDQSPANATSVDHFASGESRIQVELKDYDVFIMDFGERFRLQAGTSQQARLGSTATGPAAATTSSDESSSGNAQDLQHGRLLLDAMANVAVHVLAKHHDERLILVEPLCQRLKSVKNDLEVAGMRQAHWRDSLAIAMLIGQLERDIGQDNKCHLWTEVSAARELEFYRSLMDFNRGQSFETVSAYGSNAAIIHYTPDPTAKRQVRICNQSTYLLDSGGQYLDGTTDITRTLHFGTPTEFQRETYTRVLMGSIDMMSLIFERPHEQASFRLNDLIARRHLLDIGLNYEHGTGHGIGLYSLVHEAPALIVNYNQDSARALAASGQQSKLVTGSAAVQNEPLSIRENMFTSVEPGYYKANEFGIRLENIVVTQRMAFNVSNQTSGRLEWLHFEPISLVPFEPKLIKFELLSNKQKVWLNSYNLMVRLRMTQQINYYLARLLQNQTSQRQPVQVSGANSGSRLYKQLQEQQQQQQGGNLSVVSEARRNFLRIEPLKFQQLLEQAHRWIMSKTELIPLDVPQRIAAGGSSGLGLTSRLDSSAQTANASGQLSGESAARKSATANQDEWSALGADPQGQRLVLAYMASLPFNDADAANKLADSKLDGRSQTAHGGDVGQANGTAQLAGRGPKLGQKCSGIECDLLLLEALNSHQKPPKRNGASDGLGVKRKDLADEEAEDLAQDQQADPKRSQQTLMDMFQITPTSGDSSGLSWSLVSSMWPIVGLALILVLQLAVMIYVCGSGGGGHRDRQQRESGATGAQTLARRQSLEPASSLASNSRQRQRTDRRQEVEASGQQQNESLSMSCNTTANPEQALPIVVTQNI